MTRVLLWDHDGVLVDTEALYRKATRETLASVGVELSDAAYRQLFLVESRGAWHLVEERGVAARQVVELKRARNERYVELLRTTDVAIPGALDVVRRLAAHFRMAIVTTSARAHFDVIHAGRELPTHFELVLAREDYVFAKPEPEPYLRALKALGAAADECLVIEDSERGLRAARAAGLSCWVVPSELTVDSAFEGAARRFESLAELARALLPAPAE
jgi:HAD superfamily hydrolase (TIGR01509 family)